MGKKYMLFLRLLFLFCTIVLKVVNLVLKVVNLKLQAISSCSEQNIFILVNKMFQHNSVRLSRLIDRLFTYLLNINITETWTEGIKSTDDEECRIFKL